LPRSAPPFSLSTAHLLHQWLITNLPKTTRWYVAGVANRRRR
jgi:hypothetical protein